MDFFEIDIFPTKIFGGYLNLNNNSLTEECYLLKKNTSGRVFSNEGGWQSQNLTTDILSKNNLKEIDNLTSDIINYLNNYLSSIFLPSAYISNIWVNINPPNSFNLRHNHPGSILSGTYYVKVPQNSESDIVFTRNSYFRDSNMLVFENSKTKDGKYIDSYQHSYGYRPNEGEVIFFPSYLDHEVKYNTSKEDRISISFNCILDNINLRFK